MTHQQHQHRHENHDLHRVGDKTYSDPVCGMKVAADPAKFLSRGGTTYYFCSARCMEKFSADPLRYTQKKKRPWAEAAPGAIYTCPMHPEIRQVGPGNCPKCGMALEPVVATAGDQPNPELIDMTRRFWISLVLTVPVFALEMSGHVGLSLHRFMSASVSGWVQFLFSIPVVLWAAW
ncbi:MAG: YHS domain-containing protein, partial [Betaproteobacteria bacterium]